MSNGPKSSWPQWVACALAFVMLTAALIVPAPKARAAGTVEWTLGSNGSGSTNFSGPEGVDIDPISGDIVVADMFNNRLYFIDPQGAFLVFSQYGGPSGDLLVRPNDVLFDAQGYMYVADKTSVRKFSIDSHGPLWTFTQIAKWNGTGGTAPVGALNDPFALALWNNTLYVSDTANNRVLQIPHVDSFGSTSEASVLIDSFTSPGGIEVNDEGLYVSKATFDGYVAKYDTDGNHLYDSPGLYFPHGLQLGNDGYLYVAQKPDFNGGLIRLPTDLSSVEGMSGSYAYNYGKGIALDQAHNKIYVVDNGNSQLIKYDVGSFNNKLSGLSISSGTLSPTFDPDQADYTASVGNETASVTVTPTAADGTATILVNSTAVASGTASGLLPLNVGANTITVDDTAGNGAKRTYTIVVTRAVSSNAELSDLLLSSGPLDPVFDSGTMSYAVNVANAVTSLTVTPTVADATAAVTVNGTAVASGAASGAIPLNVGANTVTVVVTAEDGTTTESYTVVVTRAPSSNAVLSGLALSSGPLDPVFDSGTTSYAAEVANAVTSLTVTPTVADATAAVTVNGTAVASGSASGAIPLNVGANTVTVVVAAEDGTTTESYTVLVTRAGSSNAELSDLSLSSGPLDPAFDSGTMSYAVNVGNAVTSLTVTPTVSDATATVTVNGTAVASGAASGAIPLNVGANTVAVVVTAEDGTTTAGYTVAVTRAGSSNAELSDLSLSSGPLDPAFDSGTMSYAVNVGNAVTSLTVTPTVADATATVAVNGTAVASGAASGAIPLNVGANTVTVVVTAEDGTTAESYTVAIARAPSSHAELSDLSLSSGTLDPAFDSGTTSYAVNVGNAATSLTVTPTAADATATITVNGTAVASGAASSAIPLNVGANTVTVIVTAEDGTTTNAYTIQVRRNPPYVPFVPSLPAPYTLASDSSGNPVLVIQPSAIRTESDPDGRKTEVLDIAGSMLDAASGQLQPGGALTIRMDNTQRQVRIELPAAKLGELQQEHSGLAIHVEIKDSSYRLAIEALNLEGVAAKLGVELQDLQLNVIMNRSDEAAEAAAGQAAGAIGAKLAGPVVEFKIVVQAGDKSVELDDFGGIYMARAIMPDAAYHGQKLAGVLYDPAMKSFSYVPSLFGERSDGREQVVMNVPHNSLYTVLVLPHVTFGDLGGHWARQDIEEMAARLIVQGVEAGKFAPDQSITRAEFTALLVRALGLSVHADASVTTFADVDANAWYARDIESAVQAGLIQGIAPDRFAPGERITREQMAVMITGALAIAGKPAPTADGAWDAFADGSEISGWAQQAVAAATVAGLLQGVGDNRFAPGEYATRAQAAAVLKRFLLDVNFIEQEPRK